MPMPHDADVVWENKEEKTLIKRNSDGMVEITWQDKSNRLPRSPWIDGVSFFPEEIEAMAKWVRTRYPPREIIRDTTEWEVCNADAT